MRIEDDVLDKVCILNELSVLMNCVEAKRLEERRRHFDVWHRDKVTQGEREHKLKLGDKELKKFLRNFLIILNGPYVTV